MSILIKGMEMPTTCCYCKMIAYNPDIVWNDGGINAIGGYCCVLTGELIDNTTREEHCPLIPVPPHGRLIDADALDADLEWQDMHTGEWDAVGFSIEEIENAPTIIPAEEGET